MSHYNSVQNPTDINLDAETLVSPSGEEHDVPSHSSCIIPEYSNLHISVLSKSKIIHEKDKKLNGIPKLFGLIALLSYLDISATKSIIPETASFPSKLLHHE